MFGFKVKKVNDEIHFALDGNFSISEVDIALKDICIFLKNISKINESYTSKSSGFLNMSVNFELSREYSAEDNYLIEMRLMPSNKVIMESEGFSLIEMQRLMHSIQGQLPNNFKTRFMYRVNFLELTVD